MTVHGLNIAKVIKILKKVNIFSETDEDSLKKIAKRLKLLHLKKDEIVISKGENGRAMYIIVRGAVKVHDGNHVFSTLTDGQAFGEYSLIDTEQRSASVTGLEDTELLRFDQEDFYQLLSSSAGFTQGILKVVIARLRQLDIVQEQLARSNARVKKQKEEIQSVNRKLMEINEEKNNILGIVAQDLRDPITSAISIADSLGSEIKDERPDLAEYTETMINSLWKVNNIVQRLVDIMNKGVTKSPFNYEKVDLSLLLESVYTQYRQLAESKDINIEFISEEGIADLDEEYTRQIFENLLSNAIKFSPPGKNILVKMWIEKEELITEIRDEGPGLTPDDKKKIFSKFQTLSAEPTAGERSIGLGLSMVKRYVEEMDGKIWVESEEGKGARFFVKFSRHK